MSNYERSLFIKQVNAVESAPLSKDDAAEFANLLATDQDLICERIQWLLQGAYGQGSYDAAREVIQNKRMNKNAWLLMTIGQIEFNVKADFVRRSYNKLSTDLQNSLNEAIAKLITEQLAELAA